MWTRVVGNISHTSVRWNFIVVDIYLYTLSVVSVINLSCDSFMVAKTLKKWHWNKKKWNLVMSLKENKDYELEI